MSAGADAAVAAQGEDAGTLALLWKRRFGPFFATQFLGAFNDNVFKNALVTLVTYRLAVSQGIDAQTFVAMAGGVFILPYVLFSSLAGELADRTDRAKIMRWVKFAEIIIMSLAGIGFMIQNVWFLLCVLFLMGAQSAFFSPAKYSIPIQHLRPRELVAGNGLLEAGTFLAILLGTIIGVQVAAVEGAAIYASVAVIAFACLGYMTSLAIPAAPAGSPDLRLSRNPVTATIGLIREAFARPGLGRTVLAVSWFWLAGANFLVLFPVFVKDVLGGNETVLNLFMATFSIGVAIGSLACHRLLGGAVSARLAAGATVGMGLFGIALWAAAAAFGSLSEGPELVTLGGFLSDARAWPVLAAVLGLATCGGVYATPLMALMQRLAPDETRARVIAANNVLNAVAMVSSAILLIVLGMAGLDAAQIFLVTGIGCILATLFVLPLAKLAP